MFPLSTGLIYKANMNMLYNRLMLPIKSEIRNIQELDQYSVDRFWENRLSFAFKGFVLHLRE